MTNQQSSENQFKKYIIYNTAAATQFRKWLFHSFDQKNTMQKEVMKDSNSASGEVITHSHISPLISKTPTSAWILTK